jgi:hypothetical protein
VIVAARVDVDRLDLGVIGHRQSVERVGLQSAVGTELLEIELVPERTSHLGAGLPQEEGADDTVTSSKPHARLEATVRVGLILIELGARDSASFGGHGQCQGREAQGEITRYHGIHPGGGAASRAPPAPVLSFCVVRRGCATRGSGR